MYLPRLWLILYKDVKGESINTGKLQCDMYDLCNSSILQMARIGKKKESSVTLSALSQSFPIAVRKYKYLMNAFMSIYFVWQSFSLVMMD